MTEKETRDKALTEAMGECWHETELLYRGRRLLCGKCEEILTEVVDGTNVTFTCNNDFSTWSGFGKLWEWSKYQLWWSSFAVSLWDKLGFNHSCDQSIPLFYTNPDTFASALYKFLQQEEL